MVSNTRNKKRDPSVESSGTAVPSEPSEADRPFQPWRLCCHRSWTDHGRREGDRQTMKKAPKVDNVLGFDYDVGRSGVLAH